MSAPKINIDTIDKDDLLFLINSLPNKERWELIAEIERILDEGGGS